MVYPIIPQILAKFIWEILPSIICSKDIYIGLKNILDKFVELLKPVKCLKFIFYQVHPTHPSMVIYESDKPLSSI